MSRGSPSKPINGERLGPLFEALSDGDRRHLLRALAASVEPIPFEEAVASVAAAREADGDAPPARRELRASLHHNHVPKLVEMGLVAEEASGIAYAATGRVDAVVTALLDLEGAPK